MMGQKLITKTTTAVFAAGLLLGGSVFAQDEAAPEAATLDELVQLVGQDRINQQQELDRVLADFQANRAQQQQLLANARSTRDAEERRSERLKDQFDSNELLLADKEQQLAERLGTLKELFGHLTGSAGDARERIDQSITSAQYPGRTDFLGDMIDKMASTTELPTIDEINRLWTEILFETVETAKIVKFNAPVVTPDGQQQEREIVRIGNYNLVSDGEYLRYEPSTGRIEVLPRQPSSYQSAAADLQSSTSGISGVGLDPTGPRGGTFLSALIATPSLGEKWHQGGLVGYIITGLGAIGVLLAIWRVFALSIVSGKVSSQLKSDTPNNNNPLGRVLNVYHENRSADIETLELKLNEAILKERPAIVAWLNALKIIAAVAPLLGLLGTVTGMIVTFQGITLFGAGDVQGMAGGISQALVTTVLGLCVAIPTVLLHSLVNSRATRIVHILEEQAAGIVAEKAEGK